MFGPKELIVIAVLFLLLFGGRGKISSIMGDVAKGITSFKKGLKEDPDGAAVDAAAEEAIDVTPPAQKTAKKAAKKTVKNAK